MPASLGGLRSLEVCALHGVELQNNHNKETRVKPSKFCAQVLDLSGCAFMRELPSSLGDLRELKMLNLRHALFIRLSLLPFRAHNCTVYTWLVETLPGWMR